MSSVNSPCAACKFLRRKCTQECDFAPYFPPDHPQKFATVHRVFGASNVAKILKELHHTQREDAVNSLAYEAEARLRDPVYGCVGLISILQHRLRQLQTDLINTKKELANYIGPQAMLTIPPQAFTPQQIMGNSAASSSSGMPMLGYPSGALMVREPHQAPAGHYQHPPFFEAQPQLAAAMAAREREEILRTYEQQQQQQQQQQQELSLFNGGFDAGDSVSDTRFHHLTDAAGIRPSLALGTFESSFQIQPQQADHNHSQLEAQLLLPPQDAEESQLHQEQQPLHTQQTQQRSVKEEGQLTAPKISGQHLF